MEFLILWILFAVGALTLVALFVRGRCVHCGSETFLVSRLCAACKRSRNILTYTASSSGQTTSGSGLFGASRDVPTALSYEQIVRTEKWVRLLFLGFCVLAVAAYFFYDRHANYKDENTNGTAKQFVTAPEIPGGPVTANRRSRVYYPPGCSDYSKLSAKDRVIFVSIERAARAGYKAAGGCP